MVKEVLPFELLQTISEQLGFHQQPLTVGDKQYRPIVFRVNATKHFVFCLTPVTMEPFDFFEEVGDAYESYLDGSCAKDFLFFRDHNPEGLEQQVVSWYRSLAN